MGPFKILKVEENHNMHIRIESGKEYRVHTDRIKHAERPRGRRSENDISCEIQSEPQAGEEYRTNRRTTKDQRTRDRRVKVLPQKVSQPSQPTNMNQFQHKDTLASHPSRVPLGVSRSTTVRHSKNLK